MVLQLCRPGSQPLFGPSSQALSLILRPSDGKPLSLEETRRRRGPDPLHGPAIALDPVAPGGTSGRPPLQRPFRVMSTRAETLAGTAEGFLLRSVPSHERQILRPAP